MPINTSEALSLVMQVCEEEKLKVPIKESLKGGAIAFFTTAVGGLLGGPEGLAVGGAVGGLTAAYLAQNKFKSVVSVIMNDLTPAQRERLGYSVRRIINDLVDVDVGALVMLTYFPDVKERVILAVKDFFQSQLQTQIVQ